MNSFNFISHHLFLAAAGHEPARHQEPSWPERFGDRVPGVASPAEFELVDFAGPVPPADSLDAQSWASSEGQ